MTHPISFLGLVLLLGLGSACGPDEAPACIQAPVIQRLMPEANPPGGPLMIKGQNLHLVDSLFFGELIAPIEQAGDSFLTTHVPLGLQGKWGPETIRIVGNNCEDVALFEVWESYPTRTRPTSPPDIIIPTQGPRLPIKFSDITCMNQGKTCDIVLNNVWTKTCAHRLSFTENKIIFQGNHVGSDLEGISQSCNFSAAFTGDYDPDTGIYFFQMSGNINPARADILVGRIHFLDLITPQGEEAANFLLLTSKVDGRQYLYRI